jgi:glycosyltransferase involved in cell wall biosynthesis
MKQHTISLVTVCMNRLHHLQQTLPRNIIDNQEYEHLEFVVLDYNSTDGLAEWMKSSMRKYIDNGRLRYYHTLEPASYHPAHSRNMAFLLSTGELICNVDADNYTGKGFAAYINNRFCENEKSILVTFGGSKRIAASDTYGRVCVTRHDFMTVKGYDESIDKYCGEDIDLAKRVMQLGRRTVVMEDERFLQRITHDDTERIAHMALLKEIVCCYLTTDTAGFSRILFLFNNKRFVLVSLVGHGQKMNEAWQEMCDEGIYEWGDEFLHLCFDAGYSWQLHREPVGHMLSISSTPGLQPFYQVTATHHIATWAIRYMLRHIKTMRYNTQPVNVNATGQGTVFRNFDYSTPVGVGYMPQLAAFSS